MSKDINITDLFGNNINCKPEFQFILVHITKPLEYLTRLDNQENSDFIPEFDKLDKSVKDKYNIDKNNYNIYKILNSRSRDDNDSIWEININKIRSYLKESQGIDLAKYESIGDLWFPTSVIVNPVTILLGNRTSGILYCPTNYIFVARYKNGSLWKPISNNKDCEAISFLFSIKNSFNKGYMIRKDLIIPYGGRYFTVNNTTNANEFNLVSTTDVRRLTINRTKFSKEQPEFRLKSMEDNKYLTDLDHKLSTIDISKDKSQKIKYTSQGELKINNKCLSIPTDATRSRGFVYANDCNYSIGQKWYPYGNHFISQYDKSCLAQYNGHIANRPCAHNDTSQAWELDRRPDDEIKAEPNDIKQYKSTKEPGIEYHKRWYDKKGKHVILVESNNPWYLGDDKLQYTHDKNRYKSGHISNIIKNKDLYELNDLAYTHSGFDSKTNLDMDRQFTGYGLGYSYADRQLKPCGCSKKCTHINHNNANLFNKPIIEKNSTDSADNNTYITNSTSDDSTLCKGTAAYSTDKRMICGNKFCGDKNISSKYCYEVDSDDTKKSPVDYKELQNIVGTLGRCREGTTSAGKKRYECLNEANIESFTDRAKELLIDNFEDNSNTNNIIVFGILLLLFLICICIYRKKKL